MADKTADEIAAEAAAAVQAEEDKAKAAAAGGGGAGGGEEEEEAAPPKAGAEEEEFKDDDLDPEKIEAGLTAKTLTLDNAGLLKRFKKVHAALKEHKTWRSEREPKLTLLEKQALAVDSMLKGLAKYRPKENPDVEGPLEELISALMDEKGTPNWKAAKELIEQILGASEAGAGAGEGSGAGGAKPGETAEQKELRERVERVERERKAEKAEREAEKAERVRAENQEKLNGRVAKEFSEIPTELNKLPEFKGLPWKNKEWKKEFDDLVDEKILAWSSRNEKELNEGKVFPPILELAKQAAKTYLRGGSDVLKKQLEGGKPTGLNRGNGPSGAQPRKLPKPGDREDEDRYARELAEAVAE